MKISLLLILQILIVFYVVFLSGSLFVFSLPFVSIQLVSIMLAGWAFLAKKIHSRHSPKSAKKNTYFIKDGPYEFIRHPIYSALILFVSTYVQEYFTFERALAFLILIISILLSIKNDEKENEIHFKHDYLEYKNKTKKLIPYLF